MGVFPFSPEPGTPMGKLTNQIPDDVKQARVDELMLAQQEIAFAKAKSLIGKEMQVLIDRPAGRDAEDGFVARHQGQAPDIDSCVFLHAEDVHPGQMLNVKITDFQAYDLVAEIPKSKSRKLKVLAS